MTKNNIGRIQLYFNLKDPEEREIYNSISKKRNMSEYIKQAVKHYIHGADISPFLEESIKEVVRSTIREELSSGLKPEPEKSKKKIVKKEEKKVPTNIEKEEQESYQSMDVSGLEELFG